MRWLLAGLTALCLLPFVFKPLSIDDSAQVAAARDLSRHWLRPYDAPHQDGEWVRFGWTRGEAPTEANPPLYFYWTALCGDLSGWRLPLLHGGFLLLALVSVLSMLALAGRFVPAPEEAAFLFLVSPVFWITATSLLVDDCLLACALPALYLLGCGTEKTPGKSSLWPAFFLLGLAPLAKYTGLVFWPLGACWLLLSQGPRRAPRLAPYFLIPLALMAAWCALSRAAYGEAHLLAVLKVSRAGGINPAMALAFLSFFSGGLLIPFLVLPAFWSRGAAWRWAFSAAWLAQAALFASPLGDFGLAQAALLSLFITVSAAFFALLWAERRRFADARGLFLLAWLFLGMLAALSRGAGGWLVARYLLILLPAAALVTCRLVTVRKDLAACLLALSALLTAADYQQATVGPRLRDALAPLAAPAAGSRRWLPHFVPAGASLYLEPLGWRPLPAGERPKPGDQLLVFTRTLPRMFQPLPEKAEVLQVLEFTSLLPLRTNDPPSGAGFYGSLFGPLPFSFSTAPLEKVLVLRVL